jgi:pantetheine-phosphate adenylyltransferase
MHVAVGGTFDLFHKGHEELLKKALDLGEHVTIGITSDEFADKDIEPFLIRKASVESYLNKLGGHSQDIVKLEEPFGPAINDKSMDAIVVSEETFNRAIELNNIRKSKGLRELEIHKIQMVLAVDKKVLSSTRIRNGEIDRDGSKI